MKTLLKLAIGIIFLLPVTARAEQKTPVGRTVLPAFALPVSAQEQKINRLIEQLYPTEIQTVEHVQEQLFRSGQTDACQLISILHNRAYLSGLTAEQAQELAISFAYAQGCQGQLAAALFRLVDNTPSADEQMLAFYTMALVGLGHNIADWKNVQEWAFAKVEKAAQDGSAARGGMWPAAVLLMLAADALPGDWPYVMNPSQREQFERRLEGAIGRFDWIKDERTDYVITDVQSSRLWSVSNQGALISLFLQANSFFAYKDEDGLAKSMISTGGFKELDRLITLQDAQKAHDLRFSDDGETFYFSHPTPGTDGKGNFVDSVNGQRHYILSQLVYALCISYATRHGAQASDLIKNFTRRYFQINGEGEFSYYLYIALQSMRAGRELLENEFLEGWKEQEQALQKELYTQLKKNYKASWICTGVQGACEVAMEWQTFNVFFKLVGKALSAGVHMAQRAIFKVLPMQTGAVLIAFDVSAKRAVRVTGQSMKNFLQTHGWKLAAAGAVGAGIAADRPVVRPVAR